MSERSATHATFVIERTYPVPPSRVFRAFSDPVEKKKWFGGPAEWDHVRAEHDFRVGGGDVSIGGPKGEPVHAFFSHYYDIVENDRIVFSYEMLLGDNRISVSLTTVEFRAEGSGTRLTFTEQGVFLDGYDDAGQREGGTRWLLDNLGKSLEN